MLVQPQAFAIDSSHQPGSVEPSCVGASLRQQVLCRADSVAVAPPPCPVTAPPTNHRNSQAEKVGW